MGLNPLDTSRIIFERYKKYITTSLKFNDDELNSQLITLLEEPNKFSKGPIIEATPPYKKGKSLQNLIDEGVLTSEFNNFSSSDLPLDRNLYLHQERAINKICRDNKNIVVATGTGSGKTESFMIPVLNELLNEKQNKSLCPGVRALLLYPMNALANDQMKRLRKLLENEPEITFGIYTGETEDQEDKALEKFIRMHGEKPLSNELISRDKMKANPPNILLTNYAMLEYLMLRPDDSVFFEGKYSNNWKYIVIDEAHTYTGAKGIEMSMLLSRLKSTIGVPKGKLRCILTSASLGSGKSDFPKVAEFGNKLFQEDFSADDIIEAVKEELAPSKVWGEADSDVYQEVLTALSKNKSDNEDMPSILAKFKVPEEIIKIAKSMCTDSNPDKQLAYYSLLGEKRINEAIHHLSKGPLDFYELMSLVFPGENNAESKMTSLIDLCNLLRKSEQDNPLIPARYHYFVKALEGAYVAFGDSNKLFLNRMKTAVINEKEVSAFEVGSCTKCNSMYLVGEVDTDINNGYNILKESQNRFSEEGKELEFFAIIPADYSYVENEDDLIDGASQKDKDIFLLCTNCGCIRREDDVIKCNCKDGKELRLAKTKSSDSLVHKCSICGSMNTRGSIVRRFFLSEDVVSSILTTALYDQIPNKKIKAKKNPDGKSLFSGLKRNKENEVTKQLLVFSDSRQNAAYFATYLSSSYKDLLIRNILVKVIEENKEAFINNRWTLADFQRRILSFVLERKIIKGSKETVELETWRWLIREFFDKGANSLESTGYLKFIPNFDMVDDADLIFELEQFSELGLNKEEAKKLLTYLLDEFRYNKAFKYPEIVSPNDDFFSPQNFQGAFCRTYPSEAKKQSGYMIKAWKPSAKYNNSRLDFLTKLAKSRGKDYSRDAIIEILNFCYEIFVDEDSPFYGCVISESSPNYGPIQKIDTNLFCLVPGIENPDIEYYRCDKCHNITTLNIADVCPTYRCEGKLNKIDMADRLKNNHYRDLYAQLKLEKMDVSEHTAQLTTEYAAHVQNKFIKGEINVLSCSTTFELGVDVGELETVFMKNIPPTPANYAQRAGRAGRRTDSTAYALSFARLSSHDFSSFSDPYKMISGVVKPPYFEIANEKIAKRHIYACAFSKFWRKHPDYFKLVRDFFCSTDIYGPELFKKYLEENPQELLKMLIEVVPEPLHDEIGIKDWRWAEELYSEQGVMTKIVSEIQSDFASLRESEENAKSEQKYTEANIFKKTVETIEKKQLIGYLSQRNALPKYGFPVDVVNLEIKSHIEEGKNIDLSRDLQIAISEYAPESQLVANGKLWTGRYIKKIKNREPLKYNFESCRCGYFKKQLISTTNETNSSCPICGNKKINSGQYMMPEFGFITEDKVENPGSIKPKKTYSSRKHFSGVGEILESKEIILGKSIVELTSMTHGQLTVLNNGKGRGFYVCKICGYGTIEKYPSTHKSSNKRDCIGKFERVSLGYDFETDILEINFANTFRNNIEEGFWESLMYSIIEGASLALEIDRSDIDGTLYIRNQANKSLILFDTVPGGAGHVKRLLNETDLINSINKALEIVSSCDCGGDIQDTSCYSCLRNYYNQYCHEKMKRKYAIEGLKLLLEK